APIKLRIVKGANLAMERIEAAGHGWPQAPYTTKTEVDANFKRMVEYGCRAKCARAVHMGIATHNLFDVANGLLLRAEQGVEAFVEFEMLEGMANHQARAVQARAGGLLLYAPVVRAEDFHSAIPHLVPRPQPASVALGRPGARTRARHTSRPSASAPGGGGGAGAGGCPPHPPPSARRGGRPVPPRQPQDRAVEARSPGEPSAEGPFVNEPD